MELQPKVSKSFENEISEKAKEQHAQIYFSVGQYVIAWATTESVLIGLFGKILSTSHENAALLYHSNQSNYGRLKMLQVLAKANLPNERATQFFELAKRFKGYTSLRNELVHSEYSLNRETMLYYQTVTANLDIYEGGDPSIRKPIDHKWINRIKTMTKSLSVLNKDIWVFTEQFS